MKHLSKVVWEEGMYLAPHHFQAQARYFEDLVHFGISSLWFESYGLAGFELDQEALRNGTLSLVHARGIFPDGLVFHMPEADPLPEPRSIAELFPPIRESLTAMLAVAPYKPGAANCSPSAAESDHLRYTVEPHPLHDENTGEDEKPVRLGRKNIRFLLDTEDAVDDLTLPITRIMRDGSGHFIYDPRFIPPCVQVSASENLMLVVRRLIDILEEKSATVARGRQGASAKFSAGFSQQEISSFWFLHSINAALAPLRHLFLSKRGHPEELFFELSRLAGALCTFALESHPRNLPLYDHRNLEKCFGDLDEHIRTHLELIIPTNCVSIPLRQVSKYFYEGEITDARVLGRARWIFAIQSEVGEVDVINKTSTLVKICSAQLVPELVKKSLPGLGLTHLPVPPPALSPKVENQYFSVNKAGACWDNIVKSRRVGVYVPGDLINPEVELLVVLET